MIVGYQLTQIVHVAAKLNLADHLKGGPQTVAQLADLTGTHEPSLYRLLRTLAGMGVFAEEEGPRFRLTPAAELLGSRLRRKEATGPL
jgi:DNA-binding IclR family transcriptional regulator